MSKETEAAWLQEIGAALIGRTIKKVRLMTKEEQDACGWSSRAVVLVLDNGDCIWASQDDEGNDAGALFTTFKKLPTIPVFS